jgi:hypothetical protein
MNVAVDVAKETNSKYSHPIVDYSLINSSRPNIKRSPKSAS